MWSSPQPEHRPQHAETEGLDGPSLLLLKVEASPLPQARPARPLTTLVRKASSLKMFWRPGFLQDSPVAGLSYSLPTARTTHGNTGGPGSVSKSPWKNRDAGLSPLPCKLRLWGWRVICFPALSDDTGRALPGRFGGKASTERISGWDSAQGLTEDRSC